MLSLNWVDYLILIVLAFYAYGGYASGFIRALLDLTSFVLSFLIGLRFYGFFAGVLTDKFSIPQGFADAIGFFIVTFVAEIAIGILIRKFLAVQPAFLRGFNKWLGILPGIFSGIILVSFILVLIVALPVNSLIKHVVSASKMGNLLLSNTQGMEKSLNKVFGGA